MSAVDSFKLILSLPFSLIALVPLIRVSVLAGRLKEILVEFVSMQSERFRQSAAD